MLPVGNTLAGRRVLRSALTRNTTPALSLHPVGEVPVPHPSLHRSHFRVDFVGRVRPFPAGLRLHFVGAHSLHTLTFVGVPSLDGEDGMADADCCRV